MVDSNRALPIGLIEAIFTSEFAPPLFAGEATHDAALRLAAQLIRQGADDDFIRVIVTAALPEQYQGDTLDELPRMIVGARKKGIGNENSKPKVRRPRPMDVLLSLFDSQGAELFHDAANSGFIGIPTPSGGAINVSIGAEPCLRFLRELYYRATGRAIFAGDLEQMTELLRARALFDGAEFPVFTRVGGDATTACHDLGDPSGAVIEVTPNGYAPTLQPRFKMIRTQSMRPLPRAKRGGARFSGLARFKKLMGLDEERWALVLAFLLGALKSGGPYAALAVEGEQGAGKSLRCELCKAVIDPSTPMRSSLPDKVQDLMIIAAHQHLIVFDNLSGVKNDMSDALAALATKAGFQTRRLYTDDELHTFEAARPFALNGIGEFIHRPDLMDRAIPLRLEAMPEGARRTEKEIWREFDALLPELLHDLYCAVAHALANLDATPMPTEIRMADAAHWLVAAEPGAGLPAGTILATLQAAQASTQADLATQDSLFPELERVLLHGEFDGSPADLLAKLEQSVNFRSRDRYFPTTAAQLSTKLRRLRPALAKVGVIVEFPERTREGRRIRARLTEEAKQRAEQSVRARNANGPEY